MTPTPTPAVTPGSGSGSAFWDGVLGALIDWGGKLIQIAIIIVVAIIIVWILRAIIRQVVRRIVSGVKSKQNVDDTQALSASPVAAVRVVQRTRTLGTVLRNILNIVTVIVVVIMIITVINPSILTSFALLTAALGAGLGFGAQQLVQDILAGLLMVAEDQLGVGDVVIIPQAGLGEVAGVVEVVGIRITQVRDVNGTLWYVHNGQVLRLGNMSKGWERVITDLAVPYDSDIEVVQERILRVATELATTPRWRTRIVEKPELWGIQSVAEGAVVLRVVLKTRSGAKDDVARELRKRLKTSFDDLGITLPSLSSLVLLGTDGAGSIAGAHPPRTKPSPIVSTEAAKPQRRRTKRGTTPAAAAGAGPGTSTKPMPNARRSEPPITKPAADPQPTRHEEDER